MQPIHYLIISLKTRVHILSQSKSLLTAGVWPCSAANISAVRISEQAWFTSAFHCTNCSITSTKPFLAATAKAVNPSDVSSALFGSARYIARHCTIPACPLSAAISIAVAPVSAVALLTSAFCRQSSWAVLTKPNSAHMVKGVSCTLSVLAWLTSARKPRRLLMTSMLSRSAAANKGLCPVALGAFRDSFLH